MSRERWVSVDEELPPEGKHVLIAVQLDQNIVARYPNIIIAFRSRDKWVMSHSLYQSIWPVTHWRDIPMHPADDWTV